MSCRTQAGPRSIREDVHERFLKVMKRADAEIEAIRRNLVTPKPQDRAVQWKDDDEGV